MTSFAQYSKSVPLRMCSSNLSASSTTTTVSLLNDGDEIEKDMLDKSMTIDYSSAFLPQVIFFKKKKDHFIMFAKYTQNSFMST
jgi:hypothetical protein